MSDPSFANALLAVMPNLHAFAVTLTQDPQVAEDLVQEALLRAWAHQDQFREGTSVRAWTFTILRNAFYSQWRIRRHMTIEADETRMLRLLTAPAQEISIEFREVCEAISHLPTGQREALVLVAAEGLRYEDAAQVCGVSLGTLKSRVSRARASLAKSLERSPGCSSGPDDVTRAALQ